MGGKSEMEESRVLCHYKQRPPGGATLELGQLLDVAIESKRSLACSREGTHTGVGGAHDLFLLVLG